MWLLTFICALCTPQKWLWKSQLRVLIILAICLPLLNLYQLLNHQYIHSFADYWHFLRIDLAIWALALCAVFLHQKLQPIQHKATLKMQKNCLNNKISTALRSLQHAMFILLISCVLVCIWLASYLLFLCSSKQSVKITANKHKHPIQFRIISYAKLSRLLHSS